MGKSETAGSPSLVLALQVQGYFAAKIDSLLIKVYEVKSVSISNFHQINSPSSITSMARMGANDFLIFTFGNKFRIFDWYTKQVIYNDEYTHTNTIDSIHKIGDAKDRFYLTDMNGGNRRMLIFETTNTIKFSKNIFISPTGAVCASEDGHMLGAGSVADEVDFIGFDKNCHGSCATCFGEKATHCKTCDGNRMHLSTNECFTNSCETDVLFGSNKCKACDSRCSTCEFFNYKNCLTCHPNFPYLYNTYCHECPSGQIMESGSCVPCQSGCASCESSSSFCLTCLGAFKFHQNTCIPNCPTGFFDLSGTCVQCTAPCTSC